MARPKKEQPNRKDGNYEIKVTVGKDALTGKPIRKSFYSTVSKADARQKAINYIKEQELKSYGIIKQKANLRLTEFAQSFLESVKGTIKEITYNLTYKNTIVNHIIPYFNNADISNIKQIDIQNYVNKKSQKLSKESLKKHKLCLHQIFEKTIDNDIISKNPVRNIKIPDKKEKKIKQTYNQEQTDLVTQYAKNHRFGIGPYLMLLYGITRSEILGVRYEDIDFDNSTLHIQRGITESPDPDTNKMKLTIGDLKTQYRNRIVPLSNDDINVIKSRCSSGYLVKNQYGEVCHPRNYKRRHYDVFMNEMHDFYKKQNINIPILNPHELRHTRATLWVNEGKNLYSISNVMGWSDLKMLKKIYAHKDIESDREQLGII